ncbi:integrase core domain-containing protein [Dyadobacter sp. 676]|uniref:Integrase core domain-containing protein n=1 Tax=Dyadobacter sp. 676 TaxID=3088362 RepID=A0AAU8FGK9_9BACT
MSRQAWYAAARRREKKCFEQDLILGDVRRIRRQIPGIGTAKLHDLMKDFLRGHQIKLGRDKLHKLLKDNNLLLSVILDACSRKIVGWHLDKTMQAQGSVQALDMALLSRTNPSQPLIHHSDRGVQYCSWKYVDRLRNENVSISMAESGDPNENAMAERVFRTLKEDCKLRGFLSFSAASTSIERAVHAYNNLRPHASIGYLTPTRRVDGQARSH